MDGSMQLEYVTDGRRHLVCRPYSVENLHTMAAQLGIGRHWFHTGELAHYDIPVRRKDEVEALCTLVSSREIVAIIRNANA